jgi:hypothetical protein
MDSISAALSQIEAGTFRVDADGSIWRLKATWGRHGLRSISPKRAECRLKNGYLGLKFLIDGKQYLVLAHRLVWTSLRGAIPAGMDINHLNGDKTDNSPSNMELASRGDNHRHAYRTGLRGLPKSVRQPLSPEICAEARRLRETGMSFSAIAKTLGISQTAAFRAQSK